MAHIQQLGGCADCCSVQSALGLVTGLRAVGLIKGSKSLQFMIERLHGCVRARCIERGKQTSGTRKRQQAKNQQKNSRRHKGQAAQFALLPRLYGRVHGHVGKFLISICSVAIFRTKRQPGFDVPRADQTLFFERFRQIPRAQHMRPSVVGTHCFRALRSAFPVINNGNQLSHRLGVFRHMDDGVARMR